VSEVTIEVEKDKVYKIAVDGNNGEEGVVILNYALAVVEDGICIPIKTPSAKIAVICL
jgi:hypothetical protein